jgi:hypothetical protein
MPKFRLNEFRDVARWLDKHLPAPVAYILKGWLWGLEDRYIDAKVSSALDKAIAPHRPPEPTLTAPTFTSEPSEVEGLDIIQLSSNYDE